MIRPGFLDSESRRDLIELARDGSAEHRLARRANALVLLDNGLSCQAIAEVLLLDDDTIRLWYQLYQDDGIEGLTSFGHEGGTCRLTVAQQDKLKAWIGERLPRTTRAVGAWIAAECGIEYQTRSGLIALLHRLGMEHRKPTAISRKLDPVKQASFIKAYHALMNQLSADEAVIFADAVHPTHAVRPVGCWAPKEVPVAVQQSSGRDRLNIHGAVDLETGHGGCLEHHYAVDGDRGDVSGHAVDPHLPGQCQIPSRETGAGVAGAAGPPDQTALHSGLLSTPQPDRTVMGVDAPAYHPQQVLQLLQGLQHRNAELPAQRRAQELAHLLR